MVVIMIIGKLNLILCTSSYNSNDDVTEIKNYKLDSFANQSVNFVKSKLQAKILMYKLLVMA